MSANTLDMAITCQTLTFVLGTFLATNLACHHWTRVGWCICLTCHTAARQARTTLVNAGGLLERTFTAGRYAMQLCAVYYKSWRFKDEALPADLIKRYFVLHGRCTDASWPPQSERSVTVCASGFHVTYTLAEPPTAARPLQGHREAGRRRRAGAAGRGLPLRRGRAFTVERDGYIRPRHAGARRFRLIIIRDAVTAAGKRLLCKLAHGAWYQVAPKGTPSHMLAARLHVPWRRPGLDSMLIFHEGPC